MIHTLTQFFYPATCVVCGDTPKQGVVLCERCYGEGSMHTPLDMLEEDSFFVDKIALFEFDQIQAMIHGLKYGALFYETKSIGALLMQCSDFQGFVETFDYITWVPLHWYRALRRGYNQSKVIAQSIEGYKGQSRGLLVRNSYTTSQTHYNKEQRRENISGVFQIQKGARSFVTGARVLLVDDVCTTGATARECGEVLIASGAQAVSLFTLGQA